MSRFDTDETFVYRGSVAGGNTDDGAFIRTGFSPEEQLDLDFVTGRADRLAAGTLTTAVTDAAGERFFDATPLEAIAPLQHDLLSEFDFPGGKRLRNYIYVARPTRGPLEGREAFVFLSLMEDGGAEARIIAGAGDPARGDVFGLFRMRRIER